MIRIYLDTNVFSFFNKGLFKELYNKLIPLSDEKVLFFFSQAHLNDLHRDQTENKYEELKLMEKLCKDNFLHQDFSKNIICNSLVNPLEAYEYFKPEDLSFENLFSEIFSDEDDDLGIVKTLIKTWENQEIDIGLDKHPSNNTQEAKEFYKRLGIEKSRYSMKEWMEIVGKMMDSFHNDDSIIKDARRYSKEHLKLDKFKVNINEINFNKNLANTQIGKSFLELIEEQLEISKPKDGTITRFNRVTTSFNLLNFYGFDNEKNKKVKFQNTQNDGQHCWYATMCDYVISDDKGFRNKTNFIYNLYGQTTKVFSLQEFSNHLPLIIEKEILSTFDFKRLINYDLKNGLIVSANTSIRHQQKSEIIKLSKRYFYQFNRLLKGISISDNSKHLILYRDAAEINSFIFRKDFISVTNFVFKALGTDDNFRKGFDQKDKEQLDNNEWEGRVWSSKNAIFKLLKNPESGKLNIQISNLKDDFQV